MKKRSFSADISCGKEDSFFTTAGDESSCFATSRFLFGVAILFFILASETVVCQTTNSQPVSDVTKGSAIPDMASSVTSQTPSVVRRGRPTPVSDATKKQESVKASRSNTHQNVRTDKKQKPSQRIRTARVEPGVDYTYEEYDTDDDDDDVGDDDDDDDVSEDNAAFWDKDEMQNDFASVGLGKNSKGRRRDPKRDRRKDRNRVNRNDDFGEDNRNYSHEYNIKRRVFYGYDKTSRPVRNDSTTTLVYIGMSLFHILDTNEKMQTLQALIAVRLRWIDEYLQWDPAEYGGVDTIWLPSLHIWTPDIVINNFADDSFKDFMDTYAIISYDGHVLWMFPAVVKTYCTLDVRHFPFDQQVCDIKFLSWTFHGFKLNVTFNESENQAVYYAPKNQEWYVDEMTVKSREKVYACCPEPYPDVTFSLHMTRRSLFYIINLIFPCLLIYAVSFLGFFLPVESGEKVNLEITILLALVVFLLIVGETLPPTPDAIPVLGVLFGTTMIMVSIALVFAVIVTNLYLRKDSGLRVPAWLRRCFLSSFRSRKNSLTNKVTVAENHVNDIKTCREEIEIDNLSMLSDAETVTCRTSLRCSGRRRSIYKPTESEMNVRIAYEWQVLAKCVDRLFFWLFLFASVAALTSMFAQLPRYQAT